jgi:hypothetical protein
VTVPVLNTRRLTAALIRHARRVMPPAQAPWGAAMEREAAHIEGDGAVLQWAVGCVAASYGERLKAEHYLLPLLARCYLACICIAYAMGHFMEAPYPQMLCKLFGQAKPFYPPFPFTVPLASFFMPPASGTSCYFMWAPDIWRSVLRVVESALLLFAALRLVQKRASALPTFVLAMVVSIVLSFPTLVYLFTTSVSDSPHHGFPAGSFLQRQRLLTLLFGLLYPLIVGTGIALLVHKGDTPNAMA